MTGHLGLQVDSDQSSGPDHPNRLEARFMKVGPLWSPEWLHLTSGGI